MSAQNKLSINTYKTDDFKQKMKPSILLNWKHMNPQLKRYILIHTIQAISNHKQKYLTIDELTLLLNQNTKLKSQYRTGIIRDQLKIYIENQIYYGFIDESYSKGLILNDKIYDELSTIDRIIKSINRII